MSVFYYFATLVLCFEILCFPIDSIQKFFFFSIVLFLFNFFSCFFLFTLSFPILIVSFHSLDVSIFKFFVNDITITHLMTAVQKFYYICAHTVNNVPRKILAIIKYDVQWFFSVQNGIKFSIMYLFFICH